MKKDIEPFTCIEGAFVITSAKGVDRQVDLYEREGKLFAKQCGGFIRLMNDGKTSIASVSWRGINGCGFSTRPSVWMQVEISDEA